MKLHIRPTEERDLTNLLAIYNHEVVNGTATLDLHPKSMEDWEQWYSEHTVGNHFALTAVLDGDAVGYATLSRYREKEAYKTTTELSIYVHTDHRNQGVASALMTEILDIARGRGDIHTVVSVITSGNEASLALHKKFGFTFCGTVREVGTKMGKMLDIHNYQLIL